jgi:uncharacterized protein
MKNEELNEQLLDAARWGDLSAAKLAIGAGADVNARNEFRYTPLHEAAASGGPTMVRFLINQGADAHAKTELDETPFHQAQKAGSLTSAAILEEAMEKQGGHTSRIAKQRGKSSGPDIGV